MKISIVVPVYNEADNIIPLIKEIERAMSTAQAYEIIYVDDGSQDHSRKIFQRALLEFSHFRIIRHRESYGQSAAIHTGVKHAIYPLIATLDGDGQNDPADIPRLYDFFITQQQHFSDVYMVAGWRQTRLDSRWRVFSSKFANTIRAALLGDNTPDTGCGLKVFIREKFLELPYFDHMHRFLPALVIRAGGRVISAPVNHRIRKRGVSKYDTWGRLWVGIIDLMGVIWLMKRAKQVIVEEIKDGK